MQITPNIKQFFARAKKGYAVYLYNALLVLNAYLVLRKPSVLLFIALAVNLSLSLILFPTLMSGTKLRLGDKKSALPFWRWVWQWFVAQIYLSIMFIICVVALTNYGFVTTFRIKPHEFIGIIKTYTTNQWYLFPWGLYVVWGTILAYFTYVRKFGSSMGIACTSFLRGLPALLGRDYIQLAVSTSVMILCVLCCSSIVIIFANSLCWFFAKPFFFNYPLLTASLLSFVQMIFFKKNLRNYIKRLVLSRFTLRFFLCLELALLTIMLFYSGTFNEYIIHSTKFVYPKEQLLNLLLQLMNLENRAVIFYFGWCLLMTPILGSYFAKISKGRNMIEILAGFIVMPVFFWLFTTVFGHLLDVQSVAPIFEQAQPLYIFILAIVGSVIVGMVSKNISTTEFFSVGFLEAKGVKVYGISKVVIQILVLMVPTIMMVCVGGWLLIGFQLGVLAVFMVYVLLIAISVFLYDWMHFVYLKRSG